MMTRVQELCRKLKPVMGSKIDRLWSAYLAESDADGKADIEQTLELLAAKHLGADYSIDRSPFPPPAKKFAKSGDIEVGDISYADHKMYPFSLKSHRLREHVLIAGRSGSGKTNLTFVLMQGIMARDIKVLALDWKRGYRDLMGLYPKLRVYTIGRKVAPFRFNPLIPPTGCEPHIWIKLIVDVIADAYFGGEGVISLLVAGLDHLYSKAGVFDKQQTHWPTIQDLLAWLKAVKLRGRAAMWQASAERILLAMTYGEFGAVLNTQDNSHVAELLEHNVILEMDGLSGSSDKTMFSEALTLYLYRYRLAHGPQEQLTNIIVIEEAHNLLLKKASESKESILENSIRMVRQYGLGYIFVDQSASLLSKVAFANSYATIALSQKLRSDVQAIASAMNLTDEQKQALNTLPVGSAVIRLADEYPEPFLVKIPLCTVREGSVSDKAVQERMACYYTDTTSNRAGYPSKSPVSPIPQSDRETNNKTNRNNTHPPSPRESQDITTSEKSRLVYDSEPNPPNRKMNREELRFLADVAKRPLSTTVSRYERLNLSRRRGNAIRQHLAAAGIIKAVTITTRSGQVVLYQLTDTCKSVCSAAGIRIGPRSRESLEHSFWVSRAAKHFERKGYTVSREHPIKGNGAIDLLATKGDKKVAIEVETGKSDINANLKKIKNIDFDRIVVIATTPAAVSACQKAIESADLNQSPQVEQFTWFDLS
jgi:Holliday junction resolvase-like predicted endonuclease/energy-coupling factor transporter ATP-binding protein EcfA2